MEPHTDQIPDPGKKILSLEEAVRWRETLRREGKRLAVTNGCFDLLHRGHAEYLRAARNSADALLVLLNGDDSIRRLKGPSRPVTAAPDRAYILSCLAFVDAVVIFPEDRCGAELKSLRPDVYVKGGDYTLEKLDPSEREILLACGAEFRFIPFVQGYSTTGILKRV